MSQRFQVQSRVFPPGLRRILVLCACLAACAPLEHSRAQRQPAPEAVASASLENERLEKVGELQFRPASLGLEVSIRLVRVLPGTYSLVLHQGGSCAALDGKPFGSAGDTYRAANATLEHVRIGPSGTGLGLVKRTDLRLGAGEGSILGRAVIAWSRNRPVACGVIQPR